MTDLVVKCQQHKDRLLDLIPEIEQDIQNLEAAEKKRGERREHFKQKLAATESKEEKVKVEQQIIEMEQGFAKNPIDQCLQALRDKLEIATQQLRKMNRYLERHTNTQVTDRSPTAPSAPDYWYVVEDQLPKKALRM